MSVHRDLTTDEIHYIQQWSVADNTARDALSVVATDVGKVCQVTGTAKFFILSDDSPMTWVEIGGSGGAGDVVGPASATDNAIVRFDSTTGKLIQDSGITIADGASGTLAGTNSGDVTLDSSVADVLTLTGQAISADDPGADRIVFWDDSAAKLTHLTVGTNLTITGTTLDASGGGGITLSTPQASTSGTSIDFTGIPAGTKRIDVLFSSVSTNGNSSVIIQLGDSGGIETSNYLGCATVIAGTSIAATTHYTNGFIIAAGGGAGDHRNGNFSIYLLDSSTNNWAGSGIVGYESGTVVGHGAGAKALSAVLDRIRVTTVGGTDTFDAGTINIQYQS